MGILFSSRVRAALTPVKRRAGRKDSPTIHQTNIGNCSKAPPNASFEVIPSQSFSAIGRTGCRFDWLREPLEGGQKRYYYGTQRENGRPVCTYFGTGETAELAATADAFVRVQREKDARKWPLLQKNLAAAEALLRELCKGSELLVRATLIVAGFHQHDRGAWRFKRVPQSPE
jgi:hypothetical protein